MNRMETAIGQKLAITKPFLKYFFFIFYMQLGLYNLFKWKIYWTNLQLFGVTLQLNICFLRDIKNMVILFLLANNKGWKLSEYIVLTKWMESL